MNCSAHSSAPNQGYVLVLALVFLGIFSATATAYMSSITSSLQSTRLAIENAQALSLAEAGIDKAIYELNQNVNYTGETNKPLGPGVYTISVSNVNANTKRLTATGYVMNSSNPLATKTVTALANIDPTTVSFRFSVQVGAGGVNMSNNATVRGNLSTDGSVTSTGNGVITGDIIAAGTTTSISGVTVQGNATASSLSNCIIRGSAYYQTISSCTVTGTKYPGSPIPQTQSMPISDEQIAEWEALAAEGGVIAGPYTINGYQTLGPKKIDGNLTVNGTLVLSGVVWVKGNITFGNYATLAVSPITGNAGAILIADVPGSEALKGVVSLSNNFDAYGNGRPGSYPMILTTNSSSNALTLSNRSDGAILYASRGTINVNNNAEANQITAYRLVLTNNAEVEYRSGLQNQNFFNGPGGSWTITPRTYSIVR
jgi:cytoskeletal protein CcmA (bactofilin family)